MMSSQDPIKDAFLKVKEDILELKKQLDEIKRTIKQTENQTDTLDKPTDRQEIQTVPQEAEGLKPQNLMVSTGNEGVQTDRQTNRQTDRQIEEIRLNLKKPFKENDELSQIDKVSHLLNSLDSIKKDLRSKFKKLTSQEMLIFSTIYQLQEQGFEVDYTLLSNKTNLSQSSIRDYIQKLTKKQIPLDKIKHNNKKIILTIPEDFRKITSLNTIISLRQL